MNDQGTSSYHEPRTGISFNVVTAQDILSKSGIARWSNVLKMSSKESRIDQVLNFFNSKIKTTIFYKFRH